MQTQRRFLNIGGNSRAIAVPAHYAGWEHLILDIDPAGKPDIVCDARDLTRLKGGMFDAVYCSHNLEHFFEHDVPEVLSGFLHVLRADGFAEIRVPDIPQLMRVATERQLDIEDKLYDAPAGAVRVRDVLYGFAPKIAASNQDFYAHKTGFSLKSLSAALQRAGFVSMMQLPPRMLEIALVAFRQPPNEETIGLLRSGGEFAVAG
jgi:methyltransferase family protein